MRHTVFVGQTQEEKYARQLYGKLVKALTGADISVEGGGLHWHCDTKWGNNACKIHCFAGIEEEYLIYFERYEERVAAGRTPNHETAVYAVKEWLKGKSLEKMYQSFAFIDKRKRQLEKLRNEMLSSYPELKTQAHVELQESYGEFYRLVLSARDRNCQFFFYGNNEYPDGYFNWDETQLFKVVVSNFKATALAVKLWLCNSAMPSTIEEKCPWIKTGRLAQFYEQGRKIEGEFIVSWDDIENFYKTHFDHSWNKFVPFALSLIAELRQLGFDKTLRAGQSMSTLILSRSRRHGLRQDQPSIALDFGKDFMIADIYLSDDKRRIHYSPIAVTDELVELLRKLETYKVD